MRIPYASINGPAKDGTVDGEGSLEKLPLALLHSPLLADGWNSFLGAIRTRSSLEPAVLELIICRVAALNHAWYEWESHAPLLRAAGLQEESIQYILKAPPTSQRKHGDAVGGQELRSPSIGISALRKPGSQTQKNIEAIPAVQGQPISLQGTGKLVKKHQAVMAYTDAMTLDVQVPDTILDRLRDSFNDREVVEITAVVAAYNGVSRFLVALDVGEKNKQKGPAPRSQPPSSSLNK